jgi:hypothetical protein
MPTPIIRVRCIDDTGTNGRLVVGLEYDARPCPTCKSCGLYEIGTTSWRLGRFVVVSSPSNGSEEVVFEEKP